MFLIFSFLNNSFISTTIKKYKNFKKMNKKQNFAKKKKKYIYNKSKKKKLYKKCLIIFK